MVDTRRSRSNILSLFPLNTSGDIDPQDARDFIVSSMADEDDYFFMFRSEGHTGGMLESSLDETGSTATVVGSTTPNRWVVPKLEPVAGDPDSIFFDPKGWVGDSSLVSTYNGFTYPAGYWLNLPAGTYSWATTIFYKKNENTPSVAPADSNMFGTVFDYGEAPAAGTDFETEFYSLYNSSEQMQFAGHSNPTLLTGSLKCASYERWGIFPVSSTMADSMGGSFPFVFYFTGVNLIENVRPFYVDLRMFKVN